MILHSIFPNGKSNTLVVASNASVMGQKSQSCPGRPINGGWGESCSSLQAVGRVRPHAKISDCCCIRVTVLKILKPFDRLGLNFFTIIHILFYIIEFC